jgi:ABC-type sugar transport system substrate-binding protein
MNRKLATVAALAVVAILVGACGGGASPSAGKPKLTFVAQIDNPSQGFSWKMYQKNADKYGFEVSVCDNKNDVQQQTTCINDAVAQGADAIAINPKDEMGYVPATKAAMEKGVVVCLSMVPPAAEAIDGSTCSVSVDDILGGKTAAEAIMAFFPDGATGVEIGGQGGHVAANNRHEGFSQGIAGKNIEVLDYQNPTAWDTAEAQAIAEDMITKYGDQIQFVFTHWDNGATGVINALKAVNEPWAEEVLIIGVDGNKVGFQQVESWKNYISIAQNAETITSKVMEQSMLWIKKDPAAVKANIIPFDIISKETIGNFTAPEW